MKEFFAAFITLFTIIDIFGCIPFIINVKSNTPNWSNWKFSLFCGVLMISFLLFGEGFLDLFGIDLYSFSIAGAFIMMFISIEMLFDIKIFQTSHSKSGMIFPLAFPLVIGAGTLSSIITLNLIYGFWIMLFAILANLLVIIITLLSIKWLEKVINDDVSMVIKKVFGIILFTLSIKLIVTNIVNLIKI
jgi:multiple antibiotic resistance protein